MDARDRSGKSRSRSCSSLVSFPAVPLLPKQASCRGAFGCHLAHFATQMADRKTLAGKGLIGEIATRPRVAGWTPGSKPAYGILDPAGTGGCAIRLQGEFFTVGRTGRDRRIPATGGVWVGKP